MLVQYQITELQEMTERSDYIIENWLMQNQYFSEEQLKPTYLHLSSTAKVVKLLILGYYGH